MPSTVWTAPENPDPFVILHSAVDDTRDGHYERSLTKFLWFHNNAVRYQRQVSAVRRSFALSYWLDLATVYSPARTAFIRTRNETEQAFLKNPTNVNAFRDLASMNDRLGCGIRTADIFATVASEHQESARLVYDVAEPFLIASGRFRECGPFLDPKKRMELAAEAYQLTKQHEESRLDRGLPIPNLARTYYIQNVATLIGLLVLNDRIADARAVYNDALAIIDDGEFRAILDAAMSGHFPKPRRR